ncbi:hypothetical protein RCL_jg13220.t1 [Rhizophagus clarus]|uniref:Uncharacterized protein n=1 Tax=Rhizophagus clarus TaxID=94130 RepID=A0A8H3KUK1_9GLOM|nr:hypothetical protein RCL_jg13220.t1 [Rhizophagus clarus]
MTYMELTYSEIIGELNSILEFMEFFDHDIDAVSNKFDLIKDKVHVIYLEKPLIPNSAETVLSMSIDESETRAKNAKNVSVKFKDGKYISPSQENDLLRVYFIKDKRDKTLFVNGNEKLVCLKDMKDTSKVGTNEVQLIFQEDTHSEAINNSSITSRR